LPCTGAGELLMSLMCILALLLLILMFLNSGCLRSNDKRGGGDKV
jgi:hypothetical protein